MSNLPPGQQLAAPNKWPFVGEKSPLSVLDPWTVEIVGCVKTPTTLTLEQLQQLRRVEQAVDIHCVTRWSKPGMRFRGVLLRDVLQIVEPSPDARYISFVAHSPRAHSTSLMLDDALILGAMLAFEADGQPLPIEHGGPVRVVTPGRYFYKSLKWLKRMELLVTDRLGYWEAEAGYHNHADPQLEQRYMAPQIGQAEAAKLIRARDFCNLDLRGIDASSRDLSGLKATKALLRDANFRGAMLDAACFDQTNLSNAHFERASLRDATFVDADLEGANFEGADLRGANLQGASLFGATFVNADSTNGAIMDASTHINAEAIEQLTPMQSEWVNKHAIV